MHIFLSLIQLAVDWCNPCDIILMKNIKLDFNGQHNQSQLNKNGFSCQKPKTLLFYYETYTHVILT